MMNSPQMINAMKQHWLCPECGFRIPAAPMEKEPKHCPRCYKKHGEVVELKKISASK